MNRFLLDKMAEAGRGAVEYVTLADKADEAANRFYERVRSPLLTDLSIDWGGLPVTDVSPQRLPDLFSGQPIIITGRCTQAASATARLPGTRAGGPFRRDIPVAFSATAPSFEALAAFWARRRIDDLMSQDWLGIERGTVTPELEEQITRLGLDFRLLTQFTSFVAVEDKVVTKDGKPQRVAVPVEMPEGVSYEGVFGHNLGAETLLTANAGLALSDRLNVPRASAYTLNAPDALGGGAMRLDRAVTKSGAVPGPPPAAGPSAVPTVTEAGKSAPAGPLSEQRRMLESKLQPAVLPTLDCFRKSANAGASCANVRSGRVAIEVWLRQDSRGVRAQLQALGFAVTRGGGARMVAGTLRGEKLEQLAQLSAVEFVSLERG